MQRPELERIRVLVPVDFSDMSRQAIAWSFEYATRFPCELHVLHVVETHLSDLLPERLRDRFTSEMLAVEKAAEEELARMTRTHGPSLDRVTMHVAQGRAADEILKVAEKIDAGMIVVGTHGRTGLAHLLIGSVAERIVRHAECAVVCLKPTREKVRERVPRESEGRKARISGITPEPSPA